MILSFNAAPKYLAISIINSNFATEKKTDYLLLFIDIGELRTRALYQVS